MTFETKLKMSEGIRPVQTTLNCRGRLLDLKRPVVMAIINLSPDSFYHSLDFKRTDEVLKHAEKAVKEGAAILDLGGLSTRPGSRQIPVEEEWNRLEEPLRAIGREYGADIFISVDTYRAEVAKRAIHCGADVVNDISGGLFDPLIWEVVSEERVPYVLMHNKAKPEVMVRHAHYDDLMAEVYAFFTNRLHLLREKGVKDIVIDPGFGFSKTIQHNFELLKKVETFLTLNCPMMVGISRKTFMYKTLGAEPEDVLAVNTALHFKALESGASILRVHDVKEAVQCIRIFEAYQNA
ncbi:MAG: dihydropteroate synthase [Saprospirales bacterium]|nr:MAG: dihydropteroate synthase [Saprospirales bacterium]